MVALGSRRSPGDVAVCVSGNIIVLFINSIVLLYRCHVYLITWRNLVAAVFHQ